MKFTISFFLLIILQISAFSQINHWETAIYANDFWKYRLGTSEPSTMWRTSSFDDSAWLEGEGSIGYGDGDDSTNIAQTESLYMRRSFNVTDKSKIEMAIFHADFDDGFVAYLNDVEIARANIDGTPPAYNTWATNLREAIMYQGGLPISFTLDATSIQQILVNGQNTLAIQTHNYDGASSSDMTTLYWLSFGINDTSSEYGPTPVWFDDLSFTTPLPIVKINTQGVQINDEPAINGEMGIIWNDDGTPNSSLATPNEFLGNITIEKRGQTSLFFFPKNGYAIETKDENGLDKDVSFLDFPEEEDWILHGPYSDKTLIRNVLAMEIARSMGQYASRTRLVELIVNDQYDGVYVLMERIKRDEGRVDIANLKTEDITGDELTGGYVIKIDKGPVDWSSEYDVVNNPGQKLNFQYVSPKRGAIQPEQEMYIQAYIDSFEKAVLNPGVPFGGKTYDEYIDVQSFADHFIICELTKDVDAYRISTYMHKDKDSNGGLLKAGPIWDFNIALGNANYCNGDTDYGWVYDEHCSIINPFWWGNLFNDETFTGTVNCRWSDLRNGPLALDTLMSFIDEKVALLAPVVDRNFERWPVLTEHVWPNPLVLGTYQNEIAYLKVFLTARIAWMDANMLGTCSVPIEEEIGGDFSFEVFPNPTDNQLFVKIELPQASKVEISIFDLLGRKILTQGNESLISGNQTIEVDMSNFEHSPGIYFLGLDVNGEQSEFLQIQIR